MNMKDETVIEKPDDALLMPADRWILSAVNTLAKDVTENMDKYELGIAVQKVYDFIWDEFCDWYVELAKYRIYHAEEDPKGANCVLWVLKTVLGQRLKLLHPFMPFITEEIYSALVPEEESLMMSEWPKYRDEWNFPADENVMEHVKAIVKGIRNIRSEMDVPNSRKTKVYIVCTQEALCSGIGAVRRICETAYDGERDHHPARQSGHCGQRGICCSPGCGCPTCLLRIWWISSRNARDWQKKKQGLIKR